MSWILVPLQYLYLIWRAQANIAKANAAAGKPNHNRLLKKAVKAINACESMQVQFPEVTNRIDIARNEEALRFEIKK
ncbi:hypothetical protein [Erythrobacter aureus]|uniref:Uncharacterized protein n=1 Tax=Erythrobacter aureus TaxID=2182384 RepID=A0A345YJK0_9SPHN|nr:hypothetical protein [Erythrobacter aureus]AXK44102.1 hypothetical protein DVR09_16755 [Erythrobacter aureus]